MCCRDVRSLTRFSVLQRERALGADLRTEPAGSAPCAAAASPTAAAETKPQLADPLMLSPAANVPAMNSRSRREWHAPPGCWSRNYAVNEMTPHRTDPPRRMRAAGIDILRVDRLGLRIVNEAVNVARARTLAATLSIFTPTSATSLRYFS